MKEWIDFLFSHDGLASMGHGQRQADANLGLGWLYYAIVRITKPKVVVAIGSWRGFVPLVLAKGITDNCEQGKVIFIEPSLVDDFWRDEQVVKQYFERFGVTNIEHHLRTTQSFVDSEVYRSLNAVDLVFIDGHHSYDQVCFDFQAFEAKLRDGGLILLHDTRFVELAREYGRDNAYIQQVALFVDELRDRADLKLFDIPYGAGVTMIAKRDVRDSGPGSERMFLRNTMREATNAFNKREFDKALSLFEEVLIRRPMVASVWMLKGASLSMLRNWGGALECFEQAEDLGSGAAARETAFCRRVLNDGTASDPRSSSGSIGT